MEKEIKWSVSSEQNLYSIYQYIAEDSEIYAERFVSRLVSSTESQLKDYPNIGRAVPEFAKTPFHYLRELIFKGYRVIYDPEGSQITIVAVVHGRMDMKDKL